MSRRLSLSLLFFLVRRPQKSPPLYSSAASDVYKRQINYSPALVMGMWLGNSDTSVIGTSASNYGMPVIRKVMEFAHTQVYAKEGKWKSGQWYERPSGIQNVNGELYPSWWNKRQSQSTEKITFDKVSKKKATNCTPDLSLIHISEPTRQAEISYAVFCLKKKKKKNIKQQE